MLVWLANNIVFLLCFVFSIVFLVAEAIIPGVGLAGTVGAIFALIAVVYSAFHFGAVATSGVILILAVLCALAFTLSIRSLQQGKAKKYVLSDNLNNAIANNPNALYLGKTCVALCDLRPAGIANIDGKRVDVTTLGDFIKKGTPLKVVKVEDFNIVVEPTDAH